MKFIVKQKILSFSDSFVIYDEDESPVYKVIGKLFAFGDQLTIYDMNDEEQIYIKQKIFKLMPQYHFFKQGRKIAVIKQKFTFLKPKFNIESDLGSFKIEGNLLSYNFKILKDNAVIARVDKAFFAIRDMYAVDIAPGEDEGFLLALCIIIDQTLHDRNHNNH